MSTKKELKEAYKQMKFAMGVFQIRNTLNNKIFVGSSTNLQAMWNRQQLQLNVGSHPIPALQQDWKEWGADHFVYEILDELEPQEVEVDYRKEVKLLEEMYIEELQPFDEKGYNKRKKA